MSSRDLVQALRKPSKIKIENKKWATDFSVIDEGLPCLTSQYYTKAYLRHLFSAGEYLALELASIHNLAFYLWLVGEARRHIIEGTFATWKADMITRVKQRL